MNSLRATLLVLGLALGASAVAEDKAQDKAQVQAVIAELTGAAPSTALPAETLSPELLALIASISEDAQIEKSLRHYAAAKQAAVAVNARDAPALRAAMDRLFVAKGCVSRDVDDFLYQQALVGKIDGALVANTAQKDAWRRVQEADRHTIRATKSDLANACPLPPNPDDVASHEVEVPDLASDGTPVRVKVRYARPRSVAVSENDTSLLGTDMDRNGLRDDVQAYIASMSQEPLVVQTLTYFAVKETAVMLTDPRRPQALQRAWYEQQSAWVCTHRDIRSRKLRSKLSRRISSHIVNTDQRATAMYRAKVAVAKLDPDPEATRTVRCPLPEVAVR